jgi:hypothetical protein
LLDVSSWAASSSALALCVGPIFGHAFIQFHHCVASPATCLQVQVPAWCQGQPGLPLQQLPHIIPEQQIVTLLQQPSHGMQMSPL